MLRQVVRDLIPRGLRADEHVRGRLQRRLIDQRSIRNPHMRAIRCDPVDKREALRAVRLMDRVGLAEQGQRVAPLGDRERVALDLAPGHEGRARPGTTVRAVAVIRDDELVGDLKGEPVTSASSLQHADTLEPWGSRRPISNARALTRYSITAIAAGQTSSRKEVRDGQDLL